MIERLEHRRLMSGTGTDTPTGDYVASTTTSGSQDVPDVACDAAGNFVVVWVSNQSEPTKVKGKLVQQPYRIFARAFRADGTPITGEFQVSANTSPSPYAPAVAMDADGTFVVAWQSIRNATTTEGEVFARRYQLAPGGVTAAGAEFRVNDDTAGRQAAPRVSIAPGGDVLFAWSYTQANTSNFASVGRIFRADGTATGDVRLSDFHGQQGRSGDETSIEYAPDGSVWSAHRKDRPGGDIDVVLQRRSGTDLSPLGGEVLVGDGVGLDLLPQLATSAGGNLVVGYTAAAPNPAGGWLYGAYAQVFNSSGEAISPEMTVADTALSERMAAVGVEDNGDFVALWTQEVSGSEQRIYATRFRADGTRAGGDIKVNPDGATWWYSPTIAMQGDGDFVVAYAHAWASNVGSDVYFEVYEHEENLLA